MPTLKESKDIILIHGLYQNSLIVKVLGKRLKIQGYRVHYFDYPTLKKPLSDNVQSLSEYLQNFQEPFSIIAHSLGCLLTYHYLNLQIPSALQSVIAITPPFQGSRIVQFLKNHQSGFLVGKAKDSLLPLPSHIQWNFPIPLGIIAGTQNIGPSSLLLEKITNHIEKDSLVSDGTVYLDETQISGMADHTTLEKSHTMILFDPELPKLCDHFIKHHSFS
ncbi:esterase/lipase family protein [Ignatzschineria sp. LJL83]